ncbi:MAG: hypothetical protein ACTS41_00945 [Candidatus Hodgkinia cicadicola]
MKHNLVNSAEDVWWLRHVLQFCFNCKLSQIRESFLKIITSSERRLN